MATRRVIAATGYTTCLVAATEPRCGERLRRLLRSLCPEAGGALRPLPPLRKNLPSFVLCRIEAAADIKEALDAVCPVYVFEAVCRVRERRKPPVSYVLLGRVAIVSLDERLTGRERQVAQQLLETVPGIVAVYGKTATIGVYRVPELIHLAGEELEETIHVENGLRFVVPLGRVYVNPRLATEHARIAELVDKGEHVLDMFSGIGGFSLAIAARGRARVVVANDLNPLAANALAKSIILNRKRLKTPILVYNMDSAALPEVLSPVFERIIMNLPHGSKEFLPAALRLCSPRGCKIHLYTVARSPTEAAEGLHGLRAASVIRVLDYAPGKYIFRVDIEHNPERIATRKPRGGEPAKP